VRVRSLAMLGMLGSMACSPPDELDQTLSGSLGNTEEQSGRVSILNLTHEMQRVELYGLRPSVSLDCDAVAANPNEMLRDELFEITDRPSRVELFSGQEFSLNPSSWLQSFGFGFDFNPQFSDFEGGRACTAVLVRATNLPDTLVFWRTSLPFKRFRVDAEIPKSIRPDANTVVIEADYQGVDPEDLNPWKPEVCSASERDTNWWQACPQADRDRAAVAPPGARYTWRSVSVGPLHFVRPAFETGERIETPSRCQVPGPGDGLEWESLESDSVWKVLELEAGRDGCHYLRLQGNARERGWWLCAPIEALDALQPRDGLDVNVGVNLTESPTAETLSMWISYTQPGDDVLVDSARMVMHKGTTFPGAVGDLSWRARRRPGCAPVPENCGQMSIPVDLDMRMGPSNQDVIVGKVTRFPLGDQVFLVRSGYQTVTDALCESSVTDNINPSFPTHAEFVWIFSESRSTQ
jgi:hypothetical protein